jgi:hypothetical protein
VDVSDWLCRTTRNELSSEAVVGSELRIEVVVLVVGGGGGVMHPARVFFLGTVMFPSRVGCGSGCGSCCGSGSDARVS